MPRSLDRTQHLPVIAPGDLAVDRAILQGVAAFADRLATRGVHEALAFLNARTRFRFTGVYRVEGEQLCNLGLFDRENPTLNLAGNRCRLDDTYCSIVCATDRPFRSADAGHDRRLLRHPARASVISYFGVPVRGSGGELLGTLCHYDVRPRITPAAEVPLLERVAPLLASLVAGAPPAS
jgi:GAF domain-containing protein